MLLDVLERYLKIRGHKYMRLDGQTPVQVKNYYLESYLTFEIMSAQERGDLIDKFNRDEEIFIFILSTRAGSYTGNVKSCCTVHLSAKYDLRVHNL